MMTEVEGKAKFFALIVRYVHFLKSSFDSIDPMQTCSFRVPIHFLLVCASLNGVLSEPQRRQ